jgi:dihydroneopterin aldolase
MSSADRINVRGIRGNGFHGVLPHERREGQVFVVDVELCLDLAPAATTDQLDLTVDYSAIAEATLALIEGEPCDLIETLAERVAAAALSHGQVEEVRVTVHKPQAPVGVPVGDVSVTVVRRS